MANMDNRKKFIIRVNDNFYSTLNKFFIHNNIQAKVKFRKLMQKNEVGNTIEIKDYTEISYSITKIKIY
jgi:hypothetical protein